MGVEALIEGGLFSQEELAAAYFKGALQPLFTGTADRVSANAFSLQGYAARIGSEYSFEAREIRKEAFAGD
ncbi:MAG: hypothetical protein JF888_07745 [Candidatus Dormibacteraeota bacterium]|uniref:Uncharacterized protein n=1 Tax=Candidatus Dormiibacter inghamiae TaxID=3127013 RepID=A0A934NC40_9BACT|nr:hypothetical protein [Candidatus Dormibacteraeota bacterium]